MPWWALFITFAGLFVGVLIALAVLSQYEERERDSSCQAPARPSTETTETTDPSKAA